MIIRVALLTTVFLLTGCPENQTANPAKTTASAEPAKPAAEGDKSGADKAKPVAKGDGTKAAPKAQPKAQPKGKPAQPAKAQPVRRPARPAQAQPTA